MLGAGGWALQRRGGWAGSTCSGARERRGQLGVWGGRRIVENALQTALRQPQATSARSSSARCPLRKLQLGSQCPRDLHSFITYLDTATRPPPPPSPPHHLRLASGEQQRQPHDIPTLQNVWQGQGVGSQPAEGVRAARYQGCAAAAASGAIVPLPVYSLAASCSLGRQLEAAAAAALALPAQQLLCCATAAAAGAAKHPPWLQLWSLPARSRLASRAPPFCAPCAAAGKIIEDYPWLQDTGVIDVVLPKKQDLVLVKL